MQRAELSLPELTESSQHTEVQHEGCRLGRINRQCSIFQSRKREVCGAGSHRRSRFRTLCICSAREDRDCKLGRSEMRQSTAVLSLITASFAANKQSPVSHLTPTAPSSGCCTALALFRMADWP